MYPLLRSNDNLFHKYIKQEIKNNRFQNYIDLQDLRNIIRRKYLRDTDLEIITSYEMTYNILFKHTTNSYSLPRNTCIIIHGFYYEDLKRILFHKEQWDEQAIKTFAFYVAKMVKTIVPPLPAIDKLLLPVVA